MQPAHNNTRYIVDSDSKEIQFEWKSKLDEVIQIEVFSDRQFKDQAISLQSKENKLVKNLKKAFTIMTQIRQCRIK